MQILCTLLNLRGRSFQGVWLKQQNGRQKQNMLYYNFYCGTPEQLQLRHNSDNALMYLY